MKKALLSLNEKWLLFWTELHRPAIKPGSLSFPDVPCRQSESASINNIFSGSFHFSACPTTVRPRDAAKPLSRPSLACQGDKQF